jgi:hypothetical protein
MYFIPHLFLVFSCGTTLSESLQQGHFVPFQSINI